MILDILVRHHNITEGAVTIVLDGKTAMDESRGYWPLSIDQKYSDYLQVIRAWTNLSPLTFTFRHVKRHQTDKVAYNQLHWWGNATKMLMRWPRTFFIHVQQDHLPTDNLTFSQCFTSKMGTCTGRHEIYQRLQRFVVHQPVWILHFSLLGQKG